MMFCVSLAENFFVCHMTAVAQPLLQRIQRLNKSVLAGVDASVVASHAVGVIAPSSSFPYAFPSPNCSNLSPKSGTKGRGRKGNK